MDSMLAAEYRTWIFMAFGIDVPFLSLLGESITLKEMRELVKRAALSAGRFIIDG